MLAGSDDYGSPGYLCDDDLRVLLECSVGISLDAAGAAVTLMDIRALQSFLRGRRIFRSIALMSSLALAFNGSIEGLPPPAGISQAPHHLMRSSQGSIDNEAMLNRSGLNGHGRTTLDGELICFNKNQTNSMVR